MEISIRDAAALLGLSPRTVRGQLARGDLKGRKRGRAWMLALEHVPLTEAQRRAMQDRAEEIRAVADRVLPSRAARTRSRRGRSIEDLTAFRSVLAVLAALRAVASAPSATHALREAVGEIEAVALDLAEAAHEFHLPPRVEALRRARSRLARVAGGLLTDGGAMEAVRRIETEALAAVGGLLRWAEARRTGRHTR